MGSQKQAIASIAKRLDALDKMVSALYPKVVDTFNLAKDPDLTPEQINLFKKHVLAIRELLKILHKEYDAIWKQSEELGGKKPKGKAFKARIEFLGALTALKVSLDVVEDVFGGIKPVRPSKKHPPLPKR